MKIFIYNAEKNELLDVVEDVKNAEIYDEHNIMWEQGGMGGIHHDFFITEDDTLEFEDITDSMKLEALRERKAQTANRAKERALKRGLLTDQERQEVERIFNNYVGRIRNAKGREEIIVSDHIDHTKESATNQNGIPATP